MKTDKNRFFLRKKRRETTASYDLWGWRERVGLEVVPKVGGLMMKVDDRVAGAKCCFETLKSQVAWKFWWQG